MSMKVREGGWLYVCVCVCVKVCVIVFIREIENVVNILMCVTVYVGVCLCECKGAFEYLSLRRWVEKSCPFFFFLSLPPPQKQKCFNKKKSQDRSKIIIVKRRETQTRKDVIRLAEREAKSWLPLIVCLGQRWLHFARLTLVVQRKAVRIY